MAVTFVTCPDPLGRTSFGSSPYTMSSVPCGTADDTVVIGWMIGNSGDANSLSNMAVGGDTSATTAHTEVSWGSNDYARLFYWQGTGPGTVDVAFSFTGSISIQTIGCIVYSGVSSVANITATVGGSGTTSPSVTVTSATDDVALAIIPHDNLTPTVTGQGGTLRKDVGAVLARHVVLEEPGAASVTVDCTTSATVYPIVRWGMSLTPAAGGGSSETIEHGTVTFTGQSIAYKLSSELTASTLTFSGQDVSFTYQQPGVYTAELEPGILTFSAPESYSNIGTLLETATLSFAGNNLNLRWSGDAVIDAGKIRTGVGIGVGIAF